jgi:hypothetical protein
LEAIETERDQLKIKFESLSEANAKLAASNNHLLAQLKRLEEENARLRQQPPQAAAVDSTFDSLFLECYGVDPTITTVTYPNSTAAAHDEASLSASLCMTHQPAELVCFDLPCLQGTTTIPMTSLPAILSLACFILSFVTSRITTPLSRLLLQSSFLLCLPNQSWRSFWTATWSACRHQTSLVCSYVLAHLRIATDGNVQQMTSGVERNEGTALIRSSGFGLGDVLKVTTGRSLLDAGLDRKSHSRGANEFSRAHSFNWAMLR